MYGLHRPTTSLIPGFSPTSHMKSWLVPVHKIDDVFSTRAFQDKTVLVLMDIEGSEANALESGTTLLNADPKPIWIIEIFPKKGHDEMNPAHQVFEMMFDAGYSAFSFCESSAKRCEGASSLVAISGDDMNLNFEDGGNYVFCSNEVIDSTPHFLPGIDQEFGTP